MIDKIKNHPYFKERIELLQTFDDNKISITTNDMDGVDYHVDFELKKLTGIPIDDFEFLETFNEALESSDVTRYCEEHERIIIDTCEEAFITSENYFIFSASNDTQHCKFIDDFHLWLLFESSMDETGYYPNLFYSDRYNNCHAHKFHEEYSKQMPIGNDKNTRAWVDYILEFYQLKHDLTNNTAYLYDLPEGGYPSYLNSFDTDLEIIEVSEITPMGYSITLELEDTEDNVKKYNPVSIEQCKDYNGKIYPDMIRVTFKISFMPNSINFFKELSAS